MGAACSCSEKQNESLVQDKLPLRENDTLGSTSGEFEESDSLVEKAKLDWVQAIAEGAAPDKWKVEELASEYDHIKITETVFPNGDRAVHQAVRYNNIELLHHLLTVCDANINAENTETGDTPLILAARGEQPNFVQLLLGKHDEYPLEKDATKVDVKHRNRKEETASAIAAETDNQALKRLLPPIRDFFVQTIPDSESDNDNDGENEKKELINVPENGLQRNRSQSFDEATVGAIKATSEEKETVTRSTSSPDLIDTDVVVKEGWVQKKKASGLFGSWQNRFLMIKGTFLQWSNNSSTTKVHLSKITMVDSLHGKKDIKFKVVVGILLDGEEDMMSDADDDDDDDEGEPAEAPGATVDDSRVSGVQEGRSYIFKVKSTAERDEWVEALKNAIQAFRKSSAFTSSLSG